VALDLWRHAVAGFLPGGLIYEIRSSDHRDPSQIPEIGVVQYDLTIRTLVASLDLPVPLSQMHFSVKLPRR